MSSAADGVATACMNARRFGIYDSVLAEARRFAQAHDVRSAVATLLDASPPAAPDFAPGEADGLVRSLVERAGRDEFVGCLAPLLGVDATDLRARVNEHLEAHAQDHLLSGADAIALLLHEAGVRIAFAYAGTSELALCDRLIRAPGVELVNGRGDKESAFMAAGASLIEPAAGVAVLHGARGLTNALGAIADVRRNEVGALMIVGLPSTTSAPFLPPHGEPQLIETAANFAKWAYEAGVVPSSAAQRVKVGAEFAAAAREAIRQARTRPYGPVLFGVPQDVAEKRWIPSCAVNTATSPPPVASPAPRRFTDQAATRMRRARSPVILIDDYYLKYDGADNALAELADLIGAPVFQLRYRRGAMLFERLSTARVPSFAGYYDPQSPSHRRVLAAADLLITLEDRNLYRRVVGGLPECRKIAISSDLAKVRKNGYLSEGDLALEGDPRALVSEIVKTLSTHSGAGSANGGRWCAGILDDRDRRDETVVPAEQPGPFALTLRKAIVEAIANVLEASRQPLVVDDSQMLGGILSDEYDRLPRGLRVFGDHGGFVGGGLAYATGLALSHPDATVLCTLGDQGFTNGLQGLVSAVQQQARITYLICNNQQSVSLMKQARAMDARLLDCGRHHHLNNPPYSYSAVLAAAGVEADVVDFCFDDRDTIVRAGAELRARLAVATAARAPRAIELKLPPLGPAWDGIWLTTGLEERAPNGDARTPVATA
jgi:acetolactate synthase I/II/III large subunit